MQGKLNLYDFYTMILQKMDNCGRLKVKVHVGPAVVLVMRLTFANSTGTTRCHGASDNGVTSRISNGAQPATRLWRSKILATGHSQLNVRHVHIQDGTCLQIGRMQPRTERMYCSDFLYAAPSDRPLQVVV